jgi:predicted DNA repair protein MutK
MSGGLLALLDDVAAIAKVAASSLDDVTAQTVKAGSKAAGIVIDDAAVTPRYVVGFASDRELPIIGKIAWGSIKNKLVILLPCALMLSFFAPWAITPLLMAGGLFLCFEGYEKVYALISPRAEAGDSAAALDESLDAKELEDQKVASAIRTDMILSAEIMAITLAQITTPTFLNKAMVLAAVGIAVTIAVYGAVALIVKADDLGVHLAKNRAGSASSACWPCSGSAVASSCTEWRRWAGKRRNTACSASPSRWAMRSE